MRYPAICFYRICGDWQDTQKFILAEPTQRIVLGSDPESTINPKVFQVPALTFSIKSDAIRRRHCEFWFSADSWFMRELEPSGGTWLNGRLLSTAASGCAAFALSNDDHLKLDTSLNCSSYTGVTMIIFCDGGTTRVTLPQHS